MGNMKFDIDKLESNVKPAIKSTNSCLDDAISIIASISIPKDFGGKGTLRGMNTRIRNVQSQMSAVGG